MRLFGKNPVIERLRSNPKSIQKIHLQQGMPELSSIRKKAKQNNIPVVNVPKSKMDKMSRHVNAQGVMVNVHDFEGMEYTELLEVALSKQRTLVFLDGLNDPQNLGSIFRSLGCFGHFSVVIPTHKSVSVTETVLRIASGGENHIHFAEVPNMVKAIRKAKEEGFTIAGTGIKDGESLMETQFHFPLGFVMGSEQKGLRPVVQDEVDLVLTIPMLMERLSFNVAHATTIVAYEITKQRLQKKEEYKARAVSS